MYLVFDTETNGLPTRWNAAPTDTSVWPRMIEVAWRLVSAAAETIDANAFLIRPVGFAIPPDATRIHGISTAYATQNGVPIAEALDAFMLAVGKAKALVAHYVEFDRAVIACELIRAKRKPAVLLNLRTVCTMKGTTEYCRLPGPYGPKWPKLEELHHVLFKNSPKLAHRASADVDTLTKCFVRLRELNVL